MFNFLSKNKIKKVLIIRLGAIGDVVHTTALYRAIKKTDPSVKIHYLTTKTPSMLMENDPDLEKIWIIDGKSYKYLYNYAQDLKKEKFDLCINLQPSIRNKIFSVFIGAKQILTYKKTFKLHAVENFWITAKPVFKNLVLDEDLTLFIPQKLENKVFITKNTVAFNMGVSTTRQGRRWPIKYWKELAEIVLNRYNCDIVLTGAKEDAEFSDQILDVSPKIKSLCGKLNIVENSFVLSRCKLVISGDTGPLHIATAVKTPVIGLYGAAPVSRTGPYGKNCFTVKSDRSCVPCNKRKCKYLKTGELYTPCLLDITPDKIIKIIDENNILTV